MTEWFAPRGLEHERNVYFRARARLDMAAPPAPFEIKIAAESLYRLWCNGVEVATGPARGTSTLAFYDTLDLALHLKSGRNELEVLVHCANTPSFKAAPLRPALWIEAVSTPLTWQTARDESYDAAAPLYTFQAGFCEWHDLREAKLDWQTPEYFALAKQLLPRDCARLETTIHAPRQGQTPVTLPVGKVLVFDFGHEITGGAQLEIAASDDAQIEFGYGEHLQDGRVPVRLRDEKGAIIHTFADRFATGAGHHTLGPSLQERGFRFLQIENLGTAEITVHTVRAIDRRHPLPPSTFRCNDEKLQQIYDIAHHTLSSCATDTLTDCPWREQAQWNNDLVVSAPLWLTVGGDPHLIARSLRLALSERNPAGLIYGVCPHGGHEEIVFLGANTFLPLILLELAPLDEGAARELLSPIIEVMQALAKYSDGDGLLVGPPEYWNFLEWSFAFHEWTFDQRAAASLNWFYVLALDAMAKLCCTFGQGYSGWQTHADEIFDALQARFWDDATECYREFEDDDKVSELTQALACLSPRAASIAAALAQKLAQCENDWLQPELYMMHFVLRALLEMGEHDAARHRVLRYWCPMVEAGSPTVWEANVHQHGAAAFGDWGSLCHAFSCAPLSTIPKFAKTNT
jgi:hypothetical protein